MAHTVKYLRQIYRVLYWEFLKKGSIHGLKIFLSNSSIRYAKHIWFIFLAGIIIITNITIMNLIFQYLDQPTELRLSTRKVHVSKSPFPAVAICSANKISRHKLMQYAKNVYAAQEALQPGLLANNVEEMAQQLLLLTGFFLYPDVSYTEEDRRLYKLHRILTSMYNGSEYPTEEIIYNLSPDCKDVITRGMLFGKRINVMQYFDKRIISVGACCLFNYRRKHHRNNVGRATSSISRLENVTFVPNFLLNSVQFVLQDNMSDFTFTEFASYAFQLYLFQQEDYPTVMTNSLGEILVNHRQVMYIPVQPSFYSGTQHIRSFRPPIRKCYFKDEGWRMLNRPYYSLEECLHICRMQSMQRYCGCVNPFLEPALINATKCNLLQLPCLTQWLRTFNRWSYFDYVQQSVGFQECLYCMPTCNGVSFTAYSNPSTLREATATKPYTNVLLKGLNSNRPLALIKLFYKERYAQTTRTDLISDWVVMLSRVGGVLSLFYGFSIISFIEIFYYLSGKWFVFIVKTWQLVRSGKVQESPQEMQRNAAPIYALYWNELLPPSNRLKKYPKNIIVVKNKINKKTY